MSFFFVSTVFLCFSIFYPTSVKKNIVIDIPPGQFLNKTLENLKQKKLLHSILVAKVFSKLSGYDKKIQAGEYLVDKNLNLISLFSLLLLETK